MGKHYGKYIIKEVLSLKEAGMTHHEIGEKYGFTRTQIKKLVERYNRKQRQQVEQPKHRRGRPRKTELTKYHALELRIKELERDNDLLRSFLHACGRM